MVQNSVLLPISLALNQKEPEPQLGSGKARKRNGFTPLRLICTFVSRIWYLEPQALPLV